MRRVVTLVLAVTAVVAAACGNGDDPTVTGAGGPDAAGGTTTTAPTTCVAQQEPLDPGSARHLLPGAPEPSYLTDPPTSGSHSLEEFPRGVHEAPVTRPVQARMLELGYVLVQHRDLDPDDRAAVEALVGEHTIVAPNPELGAPVVATAWTWKLTCTEVDLDALGGFIAARAGHGADGPH